MAVPLINIRLEDVRLELGLVTPTSLSACIAAAGKTGVWNKLSDFAGYSNALNATYEFSTLINETLSASQIYVAWQRVDILPLNRYLCEIFVRLNFSLTGSGSTPSINIYTGIGDDAINEPVWVLYASKLGDGLYEDKGLIRVSPNKYLFVKMELSFEKLTSDGASASLTLDTGSVIAPCIGTAEPTGVINWSNFIGTLV